MPRRNHRPKRRRPVEPLQVQQVQAAPKSTDELAAELVARGLSSPRILNGARWRPVTEVRR